MYLLHHRKCRSLVTVHPSDNNTTFCKQYVFLNAFTICARRFHSCNFLSNYEIYSIVRNLQVRRRHNRPVLDEGPRPYDKIHSEQASTCFIPNKLRSHFITLRQALLQGHFTSTSTFGSVHLIFGFPRSYRVCFVSVLGSSPPSLPVYVEEHTSFMGIYLIRMVRSVKTKRMSETKEKIRSAGNNLDTNCWVIFSDPIKGFET